MCGMNGTHPTIYQCDSTGTWPGTWFVSCSSTQWCDSVSGQCMGFLFHPRDRDFDVPRLLLDPMGAPPPGIPTPGIRTRDVLDQAVGIAFG
jgi:hypothetical protein